MTVSSRANNKHGEAVLCYCYSREGELGWGRGRSPTRSVGARATAERSEAVRGAEGAEGAEKPLYCSDIAQISSDFSGGSSAYNDCLFDVVKLRALCSVYD